MGSIVAHPATPSNCIRPGWSDNGTVHPFKAIPLEKSFVHTSVGSTSPSGT